VKTRLPYTSVIIKDAAGEILFRKDFIYQDVGSDYFDFMVRKTNASAFGCFMIGSNGKLIQSLILQLVLDLENKFGKQEIQREAFIDRINSN
jgi:hypothetical protein